MPSALLPALTPHGSLWLDRAEDEFLLDAGLAERLESSFARGAGHGLLRLGAGEAGSSLPPSLAWWRDFAMRFIADLCALGEAAQGKERRALPAPVAGELASLIDEAPPMQGGEYLRPGVLAELWRDMARALEIELIESGLPLQDFLKERDRRWRFVGRVHFNLAENRRDPDFPFAFMATYTSGLSAGGGLAAPAARPGVAGIRGRQSQTLATSRPCSRSERGLLLAEDDRRRRRHLPSPALGTGGRRALPGRCRGDGASRPCYSHAGQLGREQAEPPIGRGHRGLEPSPRFWAWTACSIFVSRSASTARR